IVSKASDDLPDPDTPVTTVKVLCGISKSMFLRLWTRAPRTTMLSVDIFTQGRWRVPKHRRSSNFRSTQESLYYTPERAGALNGASLERPHNSTTFSNRHLTRS